MDYNFKICLTHLLEHEGGYANRESDPGGPTNRGITIKRLTAWRNKGRPADDLIEVTAGDVQAMALFETRSIYKNEDWHYINGKSLPVGIDYLIFDFAVLSGAGRANRALQTAVFRHSQSPGLIDGIIGPKTIATVKRIRADDVIEMVTADRLEWMKQLPGASANPGWFSRVPAVRDVAIKMAE